MLWICANICPQEHFNFSHYIEFRNIFDPWQKGACEIHHEILKCCAIINGTFIGRFLPKSMDWYQRYILFSKLAYTVIYSLNTILLKHYWKHTSKVLRLVIPGNGIVSTFKLLFLCLTIFLNCFYTKLLILYLEKILLKINGIFENEKIYVCQALW